MSANEAGIMQRPRFSVAITTPQYQKLINNTLADSERAKRFIAAITSAVAVNPALQECEAGTILAGALLGESLNLSPSPQLGQYYLIPFEVKVKDASGKVIYRTDENGEKLKDARGRWVPLTVKHAQFVLGYKGYIQLAIRSGQYKKLNVIEIKEGELRGFDPLNEVIDALIIEDNAVREKTPTIGYYAMFEYANGFRKALYWSKEKMMSHADQYSAAFSASAYQKLMNNEIPEAEMWKYSSFWYKNFDMMALKTMLRQLIGHWGVMSTEMQSVFERDEKSAIIGDDGQPIITSGDEPTLPALLAPEQLQPEATEVVEKADLDEL